MASRLYETLFLLDPTKAAADAEAARTALHTLIEKHGGEILVSRPWDENRKLAYPVEKQKKGYYYILYYRMESTRQAGMETDLRIVELVLRHLTSVIDVKWEDTLLESARNDTGVGFAVRGMQDETAPTDITPNLAGAPAGTEGGDTDQAAAAPRRGPRREFAEKPE